MERRKGSISFAEATNMQSLGHHEYEASIHEDWSYGPAALGGFLITLISKAISIHFQTTLAKYDQPDTISLHTEFLRTASPGNVKITIQDTRLGRLSSTVHATLVQGGKARAAVYATNINRSVRSGTSMTMQNSLQPPVPPINFDAVLEDNDAYWIRFMIPYTDPSFNKILSTVIPVFEKEPCIDKSILEMWLGLTNPQDRWTMYSLPVACDLYVPPVENYYESPRNVQGYARRAIELLAEKGKPEEHYEWDLPRWYTTVNMTMDIKRNLPKEGVKWLFVRMKTTDVVEGRCDVHGQVRDEYGNLIALVQYLWFIMDASESTITRSTKESASKTSKM